MLGLICPFFSEHFKYILVTVPLMQISSSLLVFLDNGLYSPSLSLSYHFFPLDCAGVVYPPKSLPSPQPKAPSRCLKLMCSVPKFLKYALPKLEFACRVKSSAQENW
jgi:hypothetical protein